MQKVELTCRRGRVDLSEITTESSLNGEQNSGAIGKTAVVFLPVEVITAASTSSVENISCPSAGGTSCSPINHWSASAAWSRNFDRRCFIYNTTHTSLRCARQSRRGKQARTQGKV